MKDKNEAAIAAVSTETYWNPKRIVVLFQNIFNMLKDILPTV